MKTIPFTGPRPEGIGGRLFRYDRQIAITEIRATFATWRDRMVAATVLLMALAIVRSWFLPRSWIVAAWMALAVSLIAGIAAGRTIDGRLAFHASDGALAADALRPATRWRYAMAWQAIATVALAIVTLVARPTLLIVSLPAYLAGALIGHGSSALTLPGLARRRAWPGRTIRSWMRNPRAGMAGAAALAIMLPLQALALGPDATVVVVGIVAAALVLALTIVDHGMIRFMAITGHGSWRTIARHARGTLLFLGMGLPVCLPGFGPAAGGAVAVIALAGLLLMAARILAYRLHGKRFADPLVSVFVVVLALVGFSMPVLLPFVIVALLWQLQRRADAKTWMIA